MGQWDREALQARVSDPKNRIRHEAGSPNPEEIACYEQYAKKHLTLDKSEDEGRHIVVMGMTPELRELACRLGDRVTSIDISEDAIDIYRDWISPELRKKERIVHGNWFDMDRLLDETADVIMGDGVFGNLFSTEECGRLLGLIYQVLKPGGGFVTRHVMVPSDFTFDSHEFDTLIARYRAGELSDVEFGFDMRILGRWMTAYDPDSYMLDNGKVFEFYQALVKNHQLTEEEYQAIRRFYFTGRNFIPPQKVWESALMEHGFKFDQTLLRGKIWYDYYRIYHSVK